MPPETTSPFTKLSPGSPSEPTPFGKYLLVGLIARGGMAEVYRARPRIGGERLLAVKCMRPQLAKETRFVEMFIREGKLAVLLDHDSIVRTFEIGRVEGRYFIAMEYIGGKDLTQILRRCQESHQRIPVPHAIYIAARIAEGLHYAHQRSDNEGRVLNIVNRDVSPSNIRISYEGDVKLLDFGIAQAMLKFTSEIGVLKGKFSYMSPEQIRGMPLDARTDVFSTGIILHEMLTTEKLFRGDTEFALMEKVRKADITPPSKFNRRVPERLDAVSLKALSRDLDDRYQSGAEFAADLREMLGSYRFNPSELEEFVRGLFRQDYAREREEVEKCMRTNVGAEEDVSSSAVEMIIEPSAPGLIESASGPTTPGAPPLPDGVVMASHANAAMQHAATGAAGPNGEAGPGGGGAARPGLWARLKGKFTPK